MIIIIIIIIIICHNTDCCSPFYIHTTTRRVSKIAKTIIIFVISVRPSVRPHGTSGRIFIQIHILMFVENPFRKFHFHQNMTKNSGHLSHLDQFFLRIRNISGEIRNKNQNTHFLFSDIFPPKIAPFVR